jgi:hypothetical protein
MSAINVLEEIGAVIYDMEEGLKQKIQLQYSSLLLMNMLNLRWKGDRRQCGPELSVFP